MSGGLAWASVEPSTNSTIEWTTDCGWTTTSIASYGDAEQQVRLDQLEPLVDQGRAVDGDHRAHVPGRVRERLLGRHVGELVAAAAAERAAAGGEHQPSHLGGRVRHAGTGPGRSAPSRPGRSDRARPRSSPAGRRRPATPCWRARACARRRARPGWREPDRSGHAVEHDVAAATPASLGRRHPARRAAWAAANSPAVIAAALRLGVERELDVLRRRTPGRPRPPRPRAPAPARPAARRRSPPAASATTRNALGVGAHDVDGLGADRARSTRAAPHDASPHHCRPGPDR